MDNMIIAFIVFLGFIFAARYLGEKANKKLDTEKKAELIDLFSKGRVLTFGILIGILLLFYANSKFNIIDHEYSFTLYIASLFGYIIITAYFSYKKLKQNNFPDSYINIYILSTVVRFAGLGIFLLLIIP